MILIAPFFAASGAAAAFFGRELNLMMSGGEAAMALGVNTARTKAWVLVIAAAAAGAAVAVAGVVGFVGLLVPHIVRMLAGPDHRRLLPLSMTAGAVFVMGMDLLARVLSPAGEVRLGVPLGEHRRGRLSVSSIVQNRARRGSPSDAARAERTHRSITRRAADDAQGLLSARFQPGGRSDRGGHRRERRGARRRSLRACAVSRAVKGGMKIMLDQRSEPVSTGGEFVPRVAISPRNKSPRFRLPRRLDGEMGR